MEIFGEVLMADAKAFRAVVCLAAAGLVSACTSANTSGSMAAKASSSKIAAPQADQKKVYTYTSGDRECLKRAMYFESKRSSEDGFLAVGSVIMNRLTSGIYPPTICGIVSQKNQFAPGVMTRKMDEATAPALDKVADAVIKGARHPDVKDAMYFHQKGLRFRYNNMHYVAVAGGNAFYEKRGADGQLQTPEPKPVTDYMLAYAQGGGMDRLGVSAASAVAGVANPPATASASLAQPAIVEETAAGSVVQTALAGDQTSNPSVAPFITASIAKASLDRAFDTAYSVPQNRSITTGEGLASTKPSTADVPVPFDKPQRQKRSGAGMAMADAPTAPSYDNWTMRTSNW